MGGLQRRVEPPLNIDRNATADRAIDNALREHVCLLEASVLRYPDQFSWHDVHVKDPDI